MSGTDFKDKLQLNGNSIYIILFYSFVNLLILLVFNHGYGYFRDEFYYVACGENLAWGYVDHPPLIAIITKFAVTVFGKSVFALRLLPALACSASVLVAGLMIRELGGSRLALIVGLTAVAFSPVLLGISGTLSMNPFDVLFCTVILYIAILLINREDNKYWIWIGIVAGIGLLNKISVFFIAFGILIAFLLTDNRKQFKNKFLWLSTLIAFLMFLPHLIWQYVHDFPTLEFMRNAALFKNVSFSPISFITAHLLDLHPASVTLLVALLLSLFIKQYKSFRVYAIIYLSILVLFLFTNAKPYYIAILNPMILAAGSVVFVSFFENYKKRWIVIVLYAVNIPFYFATIPFALPVLEPEDYIAYSEFTGIAPSAAERHEMGPLPQHFADRFGWEELAKKVSEVYLSLPEDERDNVVVFGQNYGEAGAIDFFRDKYPLPKAVSNHNNYWIWEFPENVNDSLMIVIGSSFEDNSEFFNEVVKAGRHFNKYGMPYENVGIFICRDPKVDLRKGWQDFKSFN